MTILWSNDPIPSEVPDNTHHEDDREDEVEYWEWENDPNYVGSRWHY